MRWNPGLTAAVLVASLAGCHQKCYMTEADFQACHNGVPLIPRGLESNPHAAIIPGSANTPPPMTVLDTDRKPRPMTLAECLAIALEQGNVGSQSSLAPGIANDNLVQFNGGRVFGSDAIRVLALQPATAAAAIDSALARFDARWVTSLSWSNNDTAIANLLQSFQNGDQASFSSGLFKPLPTGGTAGVTFNTNYTFLSAPPNQQLTNPSWRPALQFLFEQPLGQFFGVEINQLRGDDPGSLLAPNLRTFGGLTNEGILITRLRFDQARAEFERNINFLLVNVEFAYWNLYGAYYTLYSREQGLRQALVSWQVSTQKFQAGLIAEPDLQQVRAQYELFRAQRLTALGQVLDRERQLRGLLGMPAEDGTRLLPVDAPTITEYHPDWHAAENEALALRPELILSRQDLKASQLNYIRVKDLLKPDLRFFATYDINGLGTRLDGGPVRFVTDPNTGQTSPQPGNALASLTDNVFNNWQVGLRLTKPFGYRDAHAQVRAARMQLSSSYLQLKDQEEKVKRILTFQYRSVVEFYETIGAQRASRQANARQLELRFQRYVAGARGETIDVLLEAQRFYADALAQEYQAIVNYNNALAGLHFAKGTILAYDNVTIAEGPLPACAQVRAVEHFRERTIALKLRERADPGVYQALHNMTVPNPDMPASGACLPLLQGPVPLSAPTPTTPPTLPPATPALPATPEGR